MPQIKPIYWVLIISMFIILYLSLSTSLLSLSKKKAIPVLTMTPTKKIKW